MTSDEQPDTEVSTPADPSPDASAAVVPKTAFRDPPAAPVGSGQKAKQPKQPKQVTSLDKPKAAKSKADRSKADKPKTDKPKTDKPKADKPSEGKSAKVDFTNVDAAKADAATAGTAAAGTDANGDKPAESPEQMLPPPVSASFASRSSSPAVLGSIIVAAVLLASTIALGILFLNERGTASDRATATRQAAAERKQVLTTAQKTAIDFSSYDYRRLDQNFAQVAGQLTGSFKKDYLATSAALKATLTQYQGVATAKALDAGVSSLSRSKAVVIVFLDQTVTSKVSKTPTVDRNRIRVALVRSGDRWLVSALDLK